MLFVDERSGISVLQIEDILGLIGLGLFPSAFING